MNKVNVLDLKGNKVDTISLPIELFEVESNTTLLAQAVRVYLSNQRQGGAKTKTRSEVNATTRKMYRQKGTGNARHGAKSAPLFVGGGISHGPNGIQDYSLTMSRQMKQKALACALSQKLSEGKVVVLDGINTLEAKTNLAAKVLENLSLTSEKSSLVVYQPSEKVIRAWRNLGKSVLMQAHMLNTYLILNGGTLIIDKNTVGLLTKLYMAKIRKNDKKETTVKSEVNGKELEKKSEVKKVSKIDMKKKVVKVNSPVKTKKNTVKKSIKANK